MNMVKSTRNSWIYQHITELTIISIVLFLFSIAFYLQINGFYLTFIDTDDFMRVVRTREFFQNHDLCNNIIERCNVPYGCSLHWTRFYDFFIIVPAYFLSFFTESINTAIDYVCFCISPVIRLATAIFFLKMLHKNAMLSRDNVFLCTVLFAVQPIIAAYGGFGRPDHHVFILFFVVLFLARYFEAAECRFRKHHISTARLTALCIWISPETLIPLLLVDVVSFVFALLRGGEDKKNLFRFIFLKNFEVIRWVELLLVVSYAASSICKTRHFYLSTELESIKNVFLVSAPMELVRFFFKFSKDSAIPGSKKLKSKIFGTFLWKLIFVPLYFGSLLVLTRFLPTYYDEISAVHWGLYVCSTYFFWILSIQERSKIRYKKFIPVFWWDACCIVSEVAIFFFMFPKFFLGMGADIDPYLKLVWLSKVKEMMSPFAGGDGLLYVLHALFVFVAIAFKLRDIFCKNHFDIRNPKNNGELLYQNFFWLTFSVLAFAYVIFGGFANRMLLYSSLFSLPLIVDFGMNNRYFSRFSKIVRIAIVVCMSIFYIVIAAVFDSDNNAKNGEISRINQEIWLKKEKSEKIVGEESEKSCWSSDTKREIFEELDHISENPVVIMAHSNDGPALLYYTKHSAVGAPYHRQREGIISSYEVMEAPYDEEKVRGILKKSGASYIFVSGHWNNCNKSRNNGNDNEEALEKGKGRSVMENGVNDSQFRKFSKQVSLSRMILGGEIPEWLEKVDMSKKFEENGVLVRVVDSI